MVSLQDTVHLKTDEADARGFHTGVETLRMLHFLSPIVLCCVAFTSCKIASQRVWCEWPWEMFVCMLSLQDAIYVQQTRQTFKVSILCVETLSMLQTRQRTKTSNLCLCSDSWEQFRSAKRIPLMWEAYYTHHTRRKLVHTNRPLRLGHCDSC